MKVSKVSDYTLFRYQSTLAFEDVFDHLILKSICLIEKENHLPFFN